MINLANLEQDQKKKDTEQKYTQSKKKKRRSSNVASLFETSIAKNVLEAFR